MQRYYALHQRYVPGFRMLKMKATDLMHMEDDGILMYASSIG